MITQQEAQAIVDGIAKGIAVTLTVNHEPTYDIDQVGNRAARLDDKGDHIRHPIETLHLSLGRVTMQIDLAHGAVSAHQRTPRTRDEVERLIMEQTGHLIKEAVRKPRTAAEHAAWQHEQSLDGARRAAEARAARDAEEQAAMSQDELAAARYLHMHGEPDYHARLDSLIAHEDHLVAAVKLGAMTADDAAVERGRIDAWRLRCEQRKAAEALHAGDPVAIAGVHRRINEGV